MSLTSQELKNAISGLPADERAELVQFLLRSLDEDDEKGTRAEWLALAEQRMAEVRAGKVVGVPAQEVLKNLLLPPDVQALRENKGGKQRAPCSKWIIRNLRTANATVRERLH
jgi:putative addiction module component (TIGR02574 family)